MEHLDRETMESLGYFFLTIGMVPKSWTDHQSGAIKVEPEDYRGPIVVWWHNYQPLVDMRSFCDARWSRAGEKVLQAMGAILLAQSESAGHTQSSLGLELQPVRRLLRVPAVIR